MVFTLKALDKDGNVFRQADIQAMSTSDIITACRDAFALAQIEQVHAFNSDGCFVLAVHRGETEHVVSVATNWWEQKPGAERHEQDTVAVLRAASRRETLWSREWDEVEAWGRLRAALRNLGGDL